MSRDFNYKIVERIGKIETNAAGTKMLELNRISYNNRAAKLDLRRWDYSDPLNPVMGKGITLTAAEAEEVNKWFARAAW